MTLERFGRWVLSKPVSRRSMRPRKDKKGVGDRFRSLTPFILPANTGLLDQTI